MSKISDKSDKFLLHYSNFFRGPLYIGTQCRPGLVTLYDIRPGNGAGLFLQPRSLHGAYNLVTSAAEDVNFQKQN